MPELPEVEVTRRGVRRAVVGRYITGVRVRQPKLRWPVSDHISALPGSRVHAVLRRGKYLMLRCDDGHVLIHLGMSGSLRVLPAAAPPGKHDHVDLLLGDRVLRLHDPRRFGSLLWVEGPVNAHPLLRQLGVEPLSARFGSEHLYRLTRSRRTPIKQFLMDARNVVGIGNIYANESLFLAGIRPDAPAGRLSRRRCARLAQAVRDTLRAAIRAGGSTLRDFVSSDGRAGYFQQQYWVYGRRGSNCRRCGAPIKHISQAQRSSFYCARCQR